MHRFPEYILLFVGLVLLQVFLLDGLNLGIWVHVLGYVGFVVLLPMELRSPWVLILGLVMGLAMDFLLASAGLNTIALLATAFARRPILILMLGKEAVGDGGTPCSARLGAGRFLRYLAAMVVVHCVVYFIFEAFGLRWFHLTALKIILSSAATVGLLWVVQLFFKR